MLNALFHGSALCAVDSDGNVSIPAFLSEMLDRESDCQLLVAKHEAETCLIGYGRDHLAILAERNERHRLADEARGEDVRNHYHRMRRSFALTDRLPRDAARLTISAAMRHLGRIEGLALFVGAGDSFEIWNPQLALASGDEQFRDLAAFTLKARDAQGVH